MIKKIARASLNYVPVISGIPCTYYLAQKEEYAAAILVIGALILFSTFVAMIEQTISSRAGKIAGLGLLAMAVSIFFSGQWLIIIATFFLSMGVHYVILVPTVFTRFFHRPTPNSTSTSATEPLMNRQH